MSTEKDANKADRLAVSALQIEINGLREELTERNAAIELKHRDLIEAQTAVTGWAAKCKAAEQRNAELVELLQDSKHYGNTSWKERVEAALKPTESGASE